jgi:hypothetical protein
MAMQLNQFKLANYAGQTMNANDVTISVRVTSTESGSYIPGQTVKLVTSEVGDCPVVVATVQADVPLGVVLQNPKKNRFYAYDMVEIAMAGSIVTMTAGMALGRGVKVYAAPTTGYISSTTLANVGLTLDVASAIGDIVRVFVNPASS